MSNPRLIPDSEIKKNVDLYLSQDEKSRIQSISVLTLKEVNAYIDFLEDIKQEYDDVQTTLRGLFCMEPRHYSDKVLLYFGKGGWYSNELCSDTATQMVYEKMVSVRLKIANISMILRLLKQQKRNLEHLESLKVSLNLRSPLAVSVKKNEKSLAALSSLDDDEKASAQVDKAGMTIKDAQDVVALEALVEYEQLMGELKASQSQNELLNKKDSEREQVLQQTLDQAHKLQGDVQSLQTQLTSEHEEKRASLCIEKAHLLKLVQFYKPTPGFFARDESDPVVIELKKLTKSSKATLTFAEIEKCIKLNTTYLDMFYNPSIENLSATDTGKLIRELGGYFRSSPSPGLAMSFVK